MAVAVVNNNDMLISSSAASASASRVEVRSVWAHNLDEEFALIRSAVPFHPFVALDTEYPGVVVASKNPYCTLTLPQRYELIRANVEALRIVQVGLTLSDAAGNLPCVIYSDGTCVSYVWEFNFRDFDISRDRYAPSSVELLKANGIDFQKNQIWGIDSCRFAQNLATSGLLSFGHFSPVSWVTFQGAYDFAFLVKMLTCDCKLPKTVREFLHLVHFFFGKRVFDVKHLYGGLERVASTVGVERAVGSRHQSGSDSLLTWQVFYQIASRDLHTTLEDENEEEVPKNGEDFDFDGAVVEKAAGAIGVKLGFHGKGQGEGLGDRTHCSLAPSSTPTTSRTRSRRWAGSTPAASCLSSSPSPFITQCDDSYRLKTSSTPWPSSTSPSSSSISSSPSLPSLSLTSTSSGPPSLSASLGGCSSSPLGSTSSSSLPTGPPGLTSLLRSSPTSGSFSNSLFHQPSCSCKSTLQLSPPLFLFPLAQTHIHHSLEIWHIQGFVLITGYLLNPEISLNVISICANYWNWDFMIMLGLSNAASVRIGNELGAAHPRVAKFAVLVMVTTNLILSLIISVLVLILHTLLRKLYTSNH
ncbi:uncharacterized protein LOC122010904 [Zingiber officinale]|uniref:uncharacterized protein LOC122010904 n=1 Tax=Zingiber officinale TaxID=94328 RepID=UPI001C4B2663|nr:uncharacterized protein LOC122010904 [Zingiber officinale]